MITSHLRGHRIEFRKDEWVYSDTKEPTVGNIRSKCGKCNHEWITDGYREYDACIGKLPFVENACCGHGDDREAYIVFKNGVRISGLVMLCYLSGG